jgi:hypothetical protein
MSDRTGGPAFPSDELHQGGQIYQQFHGMTLRDYFAAKAPIGVDDALTACGIDVPTIGMLPASERVVVLVALATMRGEYADAMLAERAK